MPLKMSFLPVFVVGELEEARMGASRETVQLRHYQNYGCLMKSNKEDDYNYYLRFVRHYKGCVTIYPCTAMSAVFNLLMHLMIVFVVVGDTFPFEVFL